ncbi:MAG: CRISPR-associated endonuclease Cas2 [Methanomicrobiales archaeon]|nr:CRISPR-associated endonuclease Cas2 [Methanomicrobiales archaeon]
MILVTYDVNTETPEGRKRLRHVAKECVNCGQRVQNSVFQCLLDPAQFAKLKHTLCCIMDNEKDSIRFYYLGKNWQNRIEDFGAKAGYDPEGLLVT